MFVVFVVSGAQVVDWRALEGELARINRAHPWAVRAKAVRHVGAETRAAWREALSRMVRQQCVG